MAAEFDDSDFIDTEFQLSRKTSAPAAPGPAASAMGVRPPTREELENRVRDTQQRLEDLKRVQEQLEQERTTLEEARRRRSEYHVGREEIMEHLTRGIGLLEQAEFGTRRQAEQMAKALGDLREHLSQVQSLNDQLWSQETYATELTRALTTLENARMEWNSARLKFDVLSGDAGTPAAKAPTSAEALAGLGMGKLCKLGLAFTWPLALVAAAAAAVFAIILLSR